MTTKILDLLLELALLRDRADQACRESQALRKSYREAIGWTRQTIDASSKYVSGQDRDERTSARGTRTNSKPSE